MRVPNLDLRAQHDNLRVEINDAIQDVINNNSFVLGPKVKKFEEEYSQYLEVNHVIGTGSGTASLQVALMALGLMPGDEVIVPNMTFYATAEAVVLCGAKPVFVDINNQNLNLDIDQIEAAITNKTVGILPVHLLGLPVEMDDLRSIAEKHNLWILEDCAHSPGAVYKGKRTGTIGSLGAFSFYPGKNIGALGEAGAIATNNDELAHRCREFRDHGSTIKFEHNSIGFNGRMDGIHAAVLSVKLKYLDSWNNKRRQVAYQYAKLLNGLPVGLPQHTNDHIYHVFTVRVQNRDIVLKEMTDRGVGVNIHYPVPMHLHPGFAYLGGQKGQFPVSEKYANEALSLPCFPEMTQDQIEYVCEKLREVVLQHEFEIV